MIGDPERYPDHPGEQDPVTCARCGKHRCVFQVPPGVVVQTGRCAVLLDGFRMRACCDDPEKNRRNKGCDVCPNLGPTPEGFGMMCRITLRVVGE